MLAPLKQHLFNVLSEINDVVWCIDATTFELLYTNEACFSLWGYNPSQMMNDQSIFFNSLHPEDIEKWKQGISDAIKLGRSYNEFRIIHKNKTIKYIQGDAIYKTGSGRLPDTITGITTDVTYIHEANKFLSTKNAELEFTLAELNSIKSDNIKVGNLLQSYQKAIDSNIICSITDKRGIITYVNNNFCNISKYSKEELIGKNHRIINSKYHPREYFEEMWQNISDGKMWNGEIKNKAKDGSYYWVDTVIIPLKNNNDNIDGYLSLRIQIDDKKKLEEDREKYLMTIEDMLFMVSHEIRKPISSCQGIIHLLKEGIPTKEGDYFSYISHLLESTTELDVYSRKLNDYLQNNIRR